MNVSDQTASVRSPLEHSKVIPQCKCTMLLTMSSFLEYLGHILILSTRQILSLILQAVELSDLIEKKHWGNMEIGADQS